MSARLQILTSLHVHSCVCVLCKFIPCLWICVIGTTVKTRNDAWSPPPCLQLHPWPRPHHSVHLCHFQNVV